MLAGDQTASGFVPMPSPEVNTYTSSADASTAATEDMIATKTTRLRRCTRRRSTARARYRSGFEYARASASPNDANATSSQLAPAQLSPLPSSESVPRASSSLREDGELAAFATAGMTLIFSAEAEMNFL